MTSRYRHKRRPRNSFGAAVADSAESANRSSPGGAFVIGALGFVLFYFVVPWLLRAWADYNKAKISGELAPMMGKLIDEIFLRRFIFPSELAGIAILVVCTLIGFWRLITRRRLSHKRVRDVSFFSRLFSRWLN
jgi:hypothetical protein